MTNQTSFPDHQAGGILECCVRYFGGGREKCEVHGGWNLPSTVEFDIEKEDDDGAGAILAKSQGRSDRQTKRH